MTGFEYGDVVLVRFPFTDHSTIKQRPAAVVSSAAYHQARPDLLIVAISSQIRSRTAFAEAEIRHWKGGRAAQALGHQASHCDHRARLDPT